MVLLSNPKVLTILWRVHSTVQDLSKDHHFAEWRCFGVTFMIHRRDRRYRLRGADGQAQLFFSARRTRLLSRISGGFMIGGARRHWRWRGAGALAERRRVEPGGAIASTGLAAANQDTGAVPDLPWFVYAMLLAPLGLVLFAAAYKTLQVRAAREWPSAPGKVVVSNSQVRKVKVLDDSREDGHRFEQRNFANIVYEYSVSGQRLTNNRVSIGEDLGNFEVAETIARYPVGTAVAVYYNPLHPREAVLERDLPKGLWGCLGIGSGIVLAIVFGGAIGLNRLSEFISARLADPKLSPLVVAFLGFGFVMALFAPALQRQASLARKWPT